VASQIGTDAEKALGTTLQFEWGSTFHLFIHSFVHQLLYRPLLGPGLFFNFVIFFTQIVGLLGWAISPWQGRHLHTGQRKHRMKAQTFMPWLGFEPTIPVFEWAKTVYTLDCAATMIVWDYLTLGEDGHRPIVPCHSFEISLTFLTYWQIFTKFSVNTEPLDVNLFLYFPVFYQQYDKHGSY
jgi:hypothetical protein